MRDARPTWTDEKFDILLGRVLQTGVLLSAIVVLGGGALYLTRHGELLPTYSVFAGEPPAMRSIGGILSAARGMSGRAVIQLGLLMLIATPLARVVFSVFGFVRQRDWTYVAITGIVLALLIYSLVYG